MALINEHYLKLRGAYLFPEIDRRIREFIERRPETRDRIIKCGIGDVSEPLPGAVIEAMHRAVDEMADRETFRGYAPPTGYPFLREAIAEHDFNALGLEIQPDEVFISDGSKTDCGAILDILSLEHRNRIGITDPVYPVYVDSNVMAGHTGAALDRGGYDGLTYLPCTADNGFVPDIPDRPLDVVYLCFPNNPTGGMITREQLTTWVSWALEHRAIILYDVAYRDYVRGEDLPRSIYQVDGARRCAMEFHSFSKNGGFTGVRCGYTVCSKELTGTTSSGEEVPLHRLWTRRWSTKSNSVGYIVQRAAEAVYSDDGCRQVRAIVDHYLENARLLRDGCDALGLTAYGGVSSPYVWVACPDGLSSWQMFDRMLERANVVITPGVGFGSCGEGYIRISAFNTRENVLDVVERMRSMSVQPV
jgi:LL-diaminopimelate aminotransferase